MICTALRHRHREIDTIEYPGSSICTDCPSPLRPLPAPGPSVQFPASTPSAEGSSPATVRSASRFG